VSNEGELVTWHRTGLRRRDETDWIAEVIVPYPQLSSAEESRGV